MLYNIFSDSLGNASSFSLMDVDKTFFDMQQALISLNENYRTDNAYNRELPQYFLKLYFTRPIYAQYKSTKEYFNVDKYAMIACGEIFDTTGRIVYSACAQDETVEKVVGDFRFNDEANQEIIAKNALNKLCEKIKKDVQFKNTKFKIVKSQDGYLELLDQIKELNSTGFKTDINLSDNTEKLDIRLVYQIKKTKEEKKGTALRQDYEIIIGAVLKNNGKSIAQDGLSRKSERSFNGLIFLNKARNFYFQRALFFCKFKRNGSCKKFNIPRLEVIAR